MTMFKLAGVLVMSGAMALAQQPSQPSQGGMQPGQAQQGAQQGAQPGASQQPAQSADPASPQAQPAEQQQPTQPAQSQGPSSAQPATAQPATAQPATAQPATAQPATAQPATAQPATAQPGMQQSQAAAGGQHPGFPAGPGMIEGCLVQTGSNYSVRAAEGGQVFSLEVNPQSAQNNNIDRGLQNSNGQMVKVYGYPTGAGGSAAQSGESSQAMTPSAAGPPQGAEGVAGAGPGGSHSGASAQQRPQQQGAASQAGNSMPMGGQAGGAAAGAGGANTLQLTRFIPLHRPCGSGNTSQAPQANRSQSAAE